jgi:hypothetical protein
MRWLVTAGRVIETIRHPLFYKSASQPKTKLNRVGRVAASHELMAHYFLDTGHPDFARASMTMLTAFDDCDKVPGGGHEG